MASVLYASTKSVGGVAYGKMILGIRDEGNDIEEALAFMNAEPGVIAKVDDVDSWHDWVEDWSGEMEASGASEMLRNAMTDDRKEGV